MNNIITYMIIAPCLMILILNVFILIYGPRRVDDAMTSFMWKTTRLFKKTP